MDAWLAKKEGNPKYEIAKMGRKEGRIRGNLLRSARADLEDLLVGTRKLTMKQTIQAGTKGVL
jgi:hypothetical protein